MKIPLKVAAGLSRWVHTAQSIVETMASARDGGPLEKAIGAVAIAGDLAQKAVPFWYPTLALQQYGFVEIPTRGLGDVLAKIIHDSGMRREVIHTADVQTAYNLWYEPGQEEASVATVTDPGNEIEGYTGIFVRKGLDIRALLQRYAWERGIDLMVTLHHEPEGKSVVLHPMGAPGSYVGEINAFAERLSKSRRASRSILLWGPSGSGKSTLGRLLARKLQGEEAHTLKIAGSVIKECQVDAVLDLAHYLSPTVLLLDDVPLRSHSDDLLTLFEALHGKVPLVISTYMDDAPDTEGQDGSDYFPGMRPGRVDWVIRTRRPGQADRERILRLYMEGVEAPYQEIAEACEGLTGAYLKEVALRLTEVGADAWREEVMMVRRAAPFEDDDDDDDEDEPK